MTESNDRLTQLLDSNEDAIDDVRELINVGDDTFDFEIATDHATVAFARNLLEHLSDDEMFALCLDMSLCPVHKCDYAICFDDDDPECANVRADYPEHDT